MTSGIRHSRKQISKEGERNSAVICKARKPLTKTDGCEFKDGEVTAESSVSGCLITARLHGVEALATDSASVATFGGNCGGHGKVVLEFFLKKIYESNAEINAVVESFLPTCTRTTPCKGRPFEGLPLLVKDNLDVEGFHTVCGSSLFINNPVAVKDSKFVAVLRELGAIPVGKTNVPPVRANCR
ncbi:hypothetical protein R1sor_012996 [Riccia sorocarpa]|uniref:Amidase domain-containing protein n=1 Tax=Riccia sorocarpa TaxID=122646 RepID=A0ABD3H585_9MARC